MNKVKVPSNVDCVCFMFLSFFLPYFFVVSFFTVCKPIRERALFLKYKMGLRLQQTQSWHIPTRRFHDGGRRTRLFHDRSCARDPLLPPHTHKRTPSQLTLARWVNMVGIPFLLNDRMGTLSADNLELVATVLWLNVIVPPALRLLDIRGRYMVSCSIPERRASIRVFRCALILHPCLVFCSFLLCSLLFDALPRDCTVVIHFFFYRVYYAGSL